MASTPSSPPAPGQVRFTFAGPIATVTLSHPSRLNALSVAMWQELARLFAELSADDRWRVIVVRGADGQFAAGADVTEFPEARADLERVYRYHQDIIAPALQAVRACRHPTVALIEGVCVGGGLEIACCCDLRLAADSARLGAPINRLGFPMAPEELQGLLAVAGRAVTLELLLEGRVLSAPEALVKGLLTRVVPAADVAAEAYRCAERIAQGAPLAARWNKQSVRRLAPDPAPFTEAELRAFYAAWTATADHREGVQAFLEKRPPVFTGEPPSALPPA